MSAKIFPALTLASLVGCSQSSPVANPEPSQESAQVSQDSQVLTGSYNCETLAYQPAGTLEFNGSSYKLGDDTGMYSFDGGTVVWKTGKFADQFGDSVYVNNGQGKSILLQPKPNEDPLLNKVCKPQ